MRDHRDAKLMAAALRESVAEDGAAISHSRALEIVARQFGLKDWNTLAAKVAEGPELAFTETCPILRIFDEAKALEFYRDYLGFTLDWEHRFAPGMPLYAQMSRAGLILHLSGHHGDATPGSTVFVRMKGIAGFHAELRSRKYPLAPGLEKAPWGLEFEVPDPFGNRLRFCES